MANYNLVIDSTFQPFSLDRYLQPLMAYGQEYQARELALSEMNQQYSKLAGQLNPSIDKESMALYNEWQGALEKEAELLNTQGLDGGGRKRLYQIANAFQESISPIENAVNIRNEQVKLQNAGKLQDNSRMYSVDMGTVSIDDLRNNPTMTYDSVSGNDITNQVHAITTKLSKDIRSNPAEWKGILETQFGNTDIPLYFERALQSGYTIDEIMNSEDSPILQSIVESVIESTGVKNWGDNNKTNAAYQYAQKGLYGALGSMNRERVANSALSLQANLALQELKPQKTDPTPTDDPFLGMEFNYLFTPSDLENRSKDANKALKALENLKTTRESALENKYPFLKFGNVGYGKPALVIQDSQNSYEQNLNTALESLNINPESFNKMSEPEKVAYLSTIANEPHKDVQGRAISRTGVSANSAQYIIERAEALGAPLQVVQSTKLKEDGTPVLGKAFSKKKDTPYTAGSIATDYTTGLKYLEYEGNILLLPDALYDVGSLGKWRGNRATIVSMQEEVKRVNNYLQTTGKTLEEAFKDNPEMLKSYKKKVKLLMEDKTKAKELDTGLLLTNNVANINKP